jgi:hypothetical protein
MSNAFLNCSFIDCFDSCRKLVPREVSGKNFICDVYIREDKKLRMKERRAKEDGREGTELVVFYQSINTPFLFYGKCEAPISLFHVAERVDPRQNRWNKDRDSKKEQLQRIGYRMM